VKKYLQTLKQSFLNYFEYRGSILSSMLMGFLGLVFSYFIWRKIFLENETVGVYNLNSLITYYLLARIFAGFFNERVTRHYEKWIKEGDLSNILLKPVNPNIYLFSKELGSRIFVTCLTMIIFLIPVILIRDLRLNIILNLSKLLWLLAFIVLSNIFLFLFYWSLGCLAFWMTTTAGLRNVTLNLLRILRGSFFPLDLAPVMLQKIFSFLPFQYALFYPLKLLTENKTLPENLKGIYILLVFILTFYTLSLFLWRKGLKTYESIGN